MDPTLHLFIYMFDYNYILAQDMKLEPVGCYDYNSGESPTYSNQRDNINWSNMIKVVRICAKLAFEKGMAHECILMSINVLTYTQFEIRAIRGTVAPYICSCSCEK